MNTIRAFIAIEMPRMVSETVRQSQQVLKSGGIHLRWVKPENVHLTLQFLGDIPITVVSDIQDILEKSTSKMVPFSLMVKNIGVFPGMRRPRVIWLGVGGQVEQLGGLQQRLSKLLGEQGLPAEMRPFKGHLTIGRVKGAIDVNRLKMAFSKLTTVETEPFQIRTVSLFKSELKPAGAEYTPLAAAIIGGAGNASGN